VDEVGGDVDEAEALLGRVPPCAAARAWARARGAWTRALALPVRRHLLAARATEQRIRETIDRAELPYAEVSTEVDALVSLMELSASRAQLLDESPPSRVAARLGVVAWSGKTELIEARAPARGPAQDGGPAGVLL
jgi:hypothetical protein